MTSKVSYVRKYGMQRATKLACSIDMKGKIQPAIVLGMSRRLGKKLVEKALRQAINRANCESRRSKRNAHSNPDAENQKIINKMTNHERSLLAKAGYPRNKKVLEIYGAAAKRRIKYAEEEKHA